MIVAALALQLALVSPAPLASAPAPLPASTPAAVPSVTVSGPLAVPPAAMSPDPVVSPIPIGGARRRYMPPLPVPSNAAEITNTGSTNTVGYHIVISPSGETQTASGGSIASVTISKKLAAQFFADLNSMAPIDAVAPRGCMKSASFGSSTSVTWQGVTSGDISCGGDPRATSLERDVQDIVKATGVSMHFRSRRQLL